MCIRDSRCIYLFIAGSYTPFCLVSLADSGGIWLCVCVWVVALAGVCLLYTSAIYDEDIFQEGRTIRWGRFVAEDNLRFLAIDPSELLSIGGCRCLIVRVWGGASLQNDSGEMRMREALVFLEAVSYTHLASRGGRRHSLRRTRFRAAQDVPHREPLPA